MQQEMFFRPEIMPFVLVGLAILVFGPVTLVRVLLHHRERMAMIRQGMHPDGQQAGIGKPINVEKPGKVEAKEPAWSDWKSQ